MNRSYSNATKLVFSSDTLPNIRSHTQTKFGPTDSKGKTEKTTKFGSPSKGKCEETNDSEDDQGSADDLKRTNYSKTTHYSTQTSNLDDSISKSIHIFLPDIHRKTQGQTFVNHLTTSNK